MEKDFEIDIVYPWVNGNDPVWKAKHDAFTGKTTGDSNNKGRFFNNNELLYSLRSIEKYAPWIHKIFIVTDNQTPEWLDLSNPKIQIVDHTEIMPPEALPTFNSTVIDHFLHKIPGLSEHFLVANDDTFLNKPVTPDTFFASDGLPRIRATHAGSRVLSVFFKEKILRHKVSTHIHGKLNASNLVKEKYGIRFNFDPHHNIDSYLRSDCEHTFSEFFDALKPTFANHLRANSNINRVLYNYVAIARKRGHLEYVGHDTSFHLRMQKPRHYVELEKSNPTFVCVNDSEHVVDADRRKAAEFLKQKFPDKSSFEK